MILALVSAVLGVLVATWLTKEHNGVAPSWLLFTTLIVVIGLVALLVAKMNEVRQSLEDIDLKGLSNVRAITIHEVSAIASELTLGARTIRVVGTARQDILTTTKSAMDYLRATERRAKARPGLYYRRITSKRLQPTFAKHLEGLLLSSSSGNDIQIAVAEHLECAISYQIWDDVCAMIIVDAPTVPGIRDNIFALLIRDGSMVAALVAHFDNAWLKCDVMRTVEDLQRSIILSH